MTNHFPHCRVRVRLALLVMDLLLALLLGVRGNAQDDQPTPWREFHVSPNGSDAANGSAEHPVRTLARARDLARQVIPTMAGDVVVTIHAGTYALASDAGAAGDGDGGTLVLDARDGAVGDHRVIYRSAPGDHPLISGGVPVTGWTHANAGGVWWQAPLQRTQKLRALMINGRRALMSGSSRSFQALGGRGDYTVHAGQAPWAWCDGKAADGVAFSGAQLPELTRNVQDVEIENRAVWSAAIAGVRACQDSGSERILLLQQPYGALAQQPLWKSGFALSGAMQVRNAYELLGVPGEFYFDRRAGLVYYTPLPGEDMARATIIAPRLAILLRIAGHWPDHIVRNLTISGLCFADSDWNLMEVAGSHGLAGVQAAVGLIAFANPNWHRDLYRSYDVVPGAVMVEGVSGLEFSRNVILRSGDQGLVLTNGIADSRIIGNRISACAGGAISLGHPQHIYENDTPDLRQPDGVGIEHERYAAGSEAAPRHVVITDNLLDDDALLFPDHAIITAFIVHDVEITHNWILRAPYTGIHLGWGWGYFNGKYGLPASQLCGDNQVCFNRIEQTMRVMHDGGAIYTIGGQPGTIIARNYVHPAHEQAIYNDEGSAWITTRANVMEWPYRRAFMAAGNGAQHDLLMTGCFVTDPLWLIGAPGTKPLDVTVCPDALWPLAGYRIVLEAGLERGYMNIVPPALALNAADLTLPASVRVQPGTLVELGPIPRGTAVHLVQLVAAKGPHPPPAMTIAASTDAQGITHHQLRVSAGGRYRLELVDAHGTVMSTATHVLAVSTWLPSADSTTPSLTEGRDGWALVGGGVPVVNHIAQEPAAFTISTALRLRRVIADGDVRRWAVCCGTNEEQDGNLSLMVAAGRLTGSINIGGGHGNEYTVSDSSGLLPLGVWTSVAMSFDGKTLRLYRSGNEVGAYPVGRARTGHSPAAGLWTLGGRGDHYSVFDCGDLDSVDLYAQGIGVAGITKLLTHTAAATPRLAHWTFSP